jgi:two-component system CheB/CheR fusion protein
MTIHDGRLHLQKRPHGPNCAIDIFLHSLARYYKNKSIAIVHSDTGHNGVKGAEDIKKAGGMVIVQQPSSAETRSMPEHAIQSGYVQAPGWIPSATTLPCWWPLSPW